MEHSVLTYGTISFLYQWWIQKWLYANYLPCSTTIFGFMSLKKCRPLTLPPPLPYFRIRHRHEPQVVSDKLKTFSSVTKIFFAAIYRLWEKFSCHFCSAYFNSYTIVSGRYRFRFVLYSHVTCLCKRRILTHRVNFSRLSFISSAFHHSI